MGIFAINVIKLSLGNLISQVISLVAVPIITRIYSPEEYGSFAIYLSITTVLASVSTLHFHRAMMVPKDRNRAANLLGLSLLSTMVFSIFVLVCISFIYWSNFLPLSRRIMRCLWWVPLGMFIQGCFLSFNFWALRSKMIGNMSIARIGESITDRSFAIGIEYFAHVGVVGLIGGRIVGPFVSLCYLAYSTLTKQIKDFWRSLSFSEMAHMAHRFREFHLFSALSLLVSKVSSEIPLLFLAFFFSPIETGFYALTLRVINMPMKVIGDAISKIFLQRAMADLNKGERLAKDTAVIFGHLIYLSLPPILILLFYGEILFSLVFGSEWRDSGAYAQILSLSFLGMFLYSPLSTLFDVYERLKQGLLVNSILLFVRGGAVIIGASLSGSVYITLLTLTVSTFIVYVGSYIYLFSLVGIRAKKIFEIFLIKIAIITPLIVGLLLSKLLHKQHHLMAAIISISLIMLQAIFILVFELRLKKEAISLFFTKKNLL